MSRKFNIKKTFLAPAIFLIVPIQCFFIASCNHIENIKPIQADGFHSDGHNASLAVDSDTSTYFETPLPNGQTPDVDDCFRRSIDFTFDGIYNVSDINIFQYVGGKYHNTYNHYEIYVSSTKDDWKKVAYKANNNIATVSGEHYHLKKCSAHIIRVNLSFNSWWDETNQGGVSGMSCPLAEITFKGYRKSNYQETSTKISDWKNTTYAKKYDEFNNNPIPIIKKEMINLVERVLGTQYINSFIFDVNHYSKSNKDDSYTISSEGNKIKIIGNNANALASGFNFYIKNYCYVDYNPLFSSNLINPQLFVPNNLPQIASPITNVAHYQYRYALNYCTYSYTMSFWKWNEWQQFLDWAVMNSINLMLDITGAEEIIRETLLDFGYSDKQVKQYICGPSYFAWFLMGNMTGYGGELSDTWFAQKVELARKIHELMQIYDITPVFQGFAGNIPDDLFPNSSQYFANSWCGFGHVQNFLNPIDSSEIFLHFLQQFNKHTIDLFGNVTNFRSADPFHERGYSNPPSDIKRSELYLDIMNKWKSVVGNNVVWLMQQWQGSVHQLDLQKLKDNGCNNNVLVLDLYADVAPMHDSMENTQTPWIWTMINNFGGRMGIFGQPSKLLNIPQQGASGNIYMSGIGIAPEAFGNSPILYETLLDMNYQAPNTKPTLQQYITNYLLRSYGQQYNEENLNPTSGAWKKILDTAYNPDMWQSNSHPGRGNYQGAPESVFNARPQHQIDHVSTWGGTNLGYDASEFKTTLNLFINSYLGNNDRDNSTNFIYDMADVSRQCLQNWALANLAEMWTNYDTNHDYAQYQQQSETFVNVMDLQDKILSKINCWSLGNWINQARNVLNNMNDWDKDLCELNARSLITTWGQVNTANPGLLNDYSNRQWSGLTNSLYKQRWSKYFNYMNNVDGVNPSHNELISNDWFKMEWEWVNQKSDEGFSFDNKPCSDNLKDLAIQVRNIIG